MIKIACKTTTGRPQGTPQLPKKRPIELKENSNEFKISVPSEEGHC